ncbi:Nucleic acid-binding, OB-fold [Pseudocohnilembus persalinus]|uniref:Nucleic acid-binding, OB-fold n=1 Tax=Pseudocohnilembus persalinus TaxID=266149 RepID=A0A0V0QAJ3_PSEPJ|nr:Nucleic acid-binding, OB-fold [Pseudocohnilembus persalinus]|eukprot:KRW99246.1 Nucleic acid-binding, OB-fold [Pseudocohnilembus persalinus]
MDNCETTLVIKPNDMHKIKNQDFIFQELQRKVGGQCTTEHGYLIFIDIQKHFKETYEQINNYSPAEVTENGMVKITQKFTGVFFKPLVGQVIDIMVDKCEDNGIHGRCGPATVLIIRDNLSPEYQYDYNDGTFKSGDQTISRDDIIRIEVDSVTVNNQQMRIVGKMNDNYLGKEF